MNSKTAIWSWYKHHDRAHPGSAWYPVLTSWAATAAATSGWSGSTGCNVMVVVMMVTVVMMVMMVIVVVLLLMVWLWSGSKGCSDNHDDDTFYNDLRTLGRWARVGWKPVSSAYQSTWRKVKTINTLGHSQSYLVCVAIRSNIIIGSRHHCHLRNHCFPSISSADGLIKQAFSFILFTKYFGVSYIFGQLKIQVNYFWVYL